MKSKKLQLLEKVLRWMSVVILKKYNPTIIGITGSVGKTSAKEAVFLALSSKYRVRKNEKNYNNEIGIPLTIIGAESGEKSPIKWFLVFLKWLWVTLMTVEYPEILVLEMGVGAPGDMKYLAGFIPVKIGIVTNISSSHLEFFKDLDHIAKEKGIMISALPEDGCAILNGDDELVMKINENSKAKLITYGFGEKNQIRAINVSYNYQDGKLSGIIFKLAYEEKVVPIRLRNILAKHQIYSVLAGIAAGNLFKVNILDVANSLENFCSPPGRMNLIPGIKRSSVIDDTYNASPTSTIAALEVLDELKAKRKIVVLGDMLELGSDMENGHRNVAQKVFEIKTDIFFGVGERMEFAVKELRKREYSPENIHYFENPELAGKKLQEVIREEDLILIKGSQGMRMEKIVEEIMAEPLKAKMYLCRQSKKWRKKPFIKP